MYLNNILFMLVQLNVGWEQLLLLFLISTYITHNYFAKCKLLLLFCLIFVIIKSLLPSSSGLGHWPLTPATWVRISLGVPIQSTTRLIFFNFNFILKKPQYHFTFKYRFCNKKRHQIYIGGAFIILF